MADTDFETILATNEYGFYCIPAAYRKREVPQVLARGEVYEANTLRFMRRLCAQVDGDIISGGAFIGDFFPALSTSLSKKQKIITFEPNPVSHAACTETLSLNGLKNVELHEVAVGETAGKLPLRVTTGSGETMGARARITGNHVEGKTIEVDVTTLDALLDAKRKVSVVQLDLEGFEWPALSGGKDMLLRDKPVIILEAEKEWVKRDYMRNINELFGDGAYACMGRVDRNVIFRPV
ncbi:MAG: FkbM family methyltransferase [Tateyamaria sp.]